MARIRDLGISAIPVMMRPPEIGPGAAFANPAALAAPVLDCAPSNPCAVCVCNESSAKQDTSLSCAPPTDCHAPSVDEETRAGYHASGFTLDSVAELKQQLQTRRKELDH